MQFYKDYLLAKPYSLLDYPFGRDVMVFKVKGKIFATLGKDRVCGQWTLNLKCDPNEAAALRETFTAITAGNHMNKKHWNSIAVEGSISRSEIARMIDNSYKLVVSSLPKKVLRLMDIENHV